MLLLNVKIHWFVSEFAEMGKKERKEERKKERKAMRDVHWTCQW